MPKIKQILARSLKKGEIARYMPNRARKERRKMKGRRMTGDAEISAWMVIAAAVLAAAVVLFAIFKPPVFGAEPKVITGSFIVSGYGDGEFAIKGEPEKKLNEGIAKVKNQMGSLPSLPGDLHLQLQFVAVGSADTTGSGNDDLAGKRSDQVKAVLSANFPEAKVISWSRGDADNIKQVRVDYRITSKPVLAQAAPISPPEKPAKFNDLGWLVAIGAFIVVIIGGFLVMTKIQENREARRSEQWLSVTVDGETYYVKVRFANGNYISPFISKSRMKISRDSKKEIINSLRGCLKKNEFAEQKMNLIKDSVINVRHGSGGAYW